MSAPTAQLASPRSADAAWPAPALAWRMVAILLGAYVLSFADRYILSLMVEPVQRDLGITDTQLGLLHGPAFAIFYTIMGLPIGRLVDRLNRRRIIVLGILVWGLMTALCGVVSGFAALFFFRMGVGIGEAALSPAAYSLIGDCFPHELRARAISVYSTGMALGVGIAIIVGGVLVELTSQWRATLPFIGEVRGWRIVLLLLGAATALYGLLCLAIREPARRDTRQSTTLAAPSVADVAAFYRRHRGTFTTLFVGLGLLGMLASGLTAWLPALLMRKFDWSAAQVGLGLGAVMLVAGTAGAYAGGLWAEYHQRRGRRDGNVRAVTGAALCCLPCAALVPLMPTGEWALLAMAAFTFFELMPWGVAGAAVLQITPNEYRGQLSALYLFSINFIGLGLGPPVVAALGDYVFGAKSGLAPAMLTTTAIFGTAAALLLLASLRKFRRSLALVED